MNFFSERALIAILRGVTPADVLSHVAVLHEQGFRSVEIPANSPDWDKSLDLVVRKFGGAVLAGAGTVLSPAQAERVAESGGKLIVTPNFNQEVVRRSKTLGLTVCCGAATPTEAFNAIEAGCDALKIFPAGIFGPAYIRAIKAVLPPDMPVLAVGGITPENLGEYLAAGCSGAGLGSDLYRAGQGVELTREKAGKFMAAAKRAPKRFC